MTEFHKRSSKTRRKQKKQIENHFERRRRPEDHKRLKQRAQQRKNERAGAGPRKREWTDDDTPELEERMRAFKPEAAKRVPTTEAPGAPVVDDPGEVRADTLLDGLVLSVTRGRAEVAWAGGVSEAVLTQQLAAVQQTALAVGDHVGLTDAGGLLRLVSVRPRRTTLSRPDPGNAHRRRVLAANVDIAVLVLSVKRPGFKPGLIDRFLIALAEGGVDPIVVANKVDLLESADERRAIERALAPYVDLGVPVVLASADRGEGVLQLADQLSGRTSVFVGHSGVGKSSLLNALDPHGERQTRSGREGDGKGRHTTTHSSLTELPEDTAVIDTPGVRAFGLWHLDRDVLRDAFPELVAHAGGCRFRDCSHLVEPGCAVQAAVEAGAIPRARFDAYARIHASLETPST